MKIFIISLFALISIQVFGQVSSIPTKTLTFLPKEKGYLYYKIVIIDNLSCYEYGASFAINMSVLSKSKSSHSVLNIEPYFYDILTSEGGCSEKFDPSKKYRVESAWYNINVQHAKKISFVVPTKWNDHGEDGEIILEVQREKPCDSNDFPTFCD